MVVSPIQKTYRLCCPRCQRDSIRINLMGEQLFFLSIDPVTGELKRGLPLGFTPGLPAALYVCADCGYDNVVPSMFIKEDSDEAAALS